jgi:hypothetical protein
LSTILGVGYWRRLDGSGLAFLDTTGYHGMILDIFFFSDGVLEVDIPTPIITCHYLLILILCCFQAKASYKFSGAQVHHFMYETIIRFSRRHLLNTQLSVAPADLANSTYRQLSGDIETMDKPARSAPISLPLSSATPINAVTPHST